LIVTTQKPFDEIGGYLEPYNNIMVVGCGTCATEVQTGGEKQVHEMAERLRGKWNVEEMVIEAPCDERIARREWRKIQRRGTDIDALLCLCCGAGVQTLAEVADLPCVPGLNTRFIGKVERIGLYYERCRACGECHLGETGGICPVTRCAKGLMNGPCGGMVDGKCEVENYTRDCGWILIWKRLRKIGRVDLFRKTRAPRDFGLIVFPREIVAPHRRAGGEATSEPESEKPLTKAVVEVTAPQKKPSESSSKSTGKGKQESVDKAQFPSMLEMKQ